MKFLEKDLENIIWESDNEKLREKGLEIYGKKFRQIRIGNYGVADLITVDRRKDCFDGNFLDITVYELKKEKAGISACRTAVRRAPRARPGCGRRRTARPGRPG